MILPMTRMRVPAPAPSGWEGMNLVRLSDSNGGSVAWVSPETGGNTIAFAIWVDGQWRHMLFLESPEAHLARPTRYGCPVLFPFPGYVRNARFQWRGGTRDLPINGPDGRSHVHGFAHDRSWRVVDARDDTVTLELATSDDLTPVERDSYPFDIVLRQVVTLSNQSLAIALEATNQGGDAAPVGLGLHPYVDPSVLNSTRQELVARLPGTLERMLAGSVPTGESRSVTSKIQELRNVEELLICHTGLGDQGFALLLGTGEHMVRLDLDGAWSDIVLYLPPDQPSVALESLTCALSAASLDPSSPDSLPLLTPGHSISASVRLRLAT